MSKVYLNGAITPLAEARLPALDAGLLLGAGLFETLRSYDGLVFRLADHLARLDASATHLDIPIQESADELTRAVAAVLEANSLRDARLRLTVTRGPLPAEGEGLPPARPTCLITAGAMTPYADELYEKGMTVTVSDVRVNDKDPTCGHKTINYLTNLLVLRDAHGRGAQEALRFNGPGRLAEGCISNVFIVTAGRLRTPPVSEGCLPGIARKVVLELAKSEGLDAVEEPIAAQELLHADEIFLTNTIMEVMPVCRIERHPIGEDRPGPVTLRLAAAYKKCVLGATL